MENELRLIYKCCDNDDYYINLIDIPKNYELTILGCEYVELNVTDKIIYINNFIGMQVYVTDLKGKNYYYRFA